MIKRFFLLLTVIVGCLGAAAQHTPGSWKVFPMSGEKFEKLAETEAFLYYITGGSLYSYDKLYGETTYYAPGTRISDSGIQDLYINADKGYMMVVYSNSNIDLIYDDGTLVNLSEIKDSNITSSKTINHVTFGNDKIYIATDFGLVVYSDTQHAVVESAILPKPLTMLLVNKDYLFTVIDYKLCYSPVGERHNSLDKFTPLGGVYMEQVQKIDDDHYLYVSSNSVYRLTINVSGKTTSFEKIREIPGIKSLFTYKNGFVAQGASTLVFFDKDGRYETTVNLSDDLAGNLFTTYNGIKSMWGADYKGVANYDLTDGKVTLLSDKFRPESSRLAGKLYGKDGGSSSYGPGFVTLGPDGSAYINTMGMSDFHPAGNSAWSQHLPYLLERYDWATSTFTPLYPYGVTNTSPQSINESVNCNSKYFFGGPANTLIDPVDPDLIYHVNNFEGIILIKNREVLYELNSSVIPINFSWGSRTFCAEFDQMGNLWIGGWAGSGNAFVILPADKIAVLRTNPSAIQKSDFVIPAKFPSNELGKMDMRLMAIPGTTKMLYFRGGWGGTTIGIDHKGTSSFSDDAFDLYTGYVDQDGTVSTPQFRCCMTLDKNNQIWIGTTSGVFVVKDLSQLGTGKSANLATVRPKVSRNDGTNYADYLLTSETILSIAVDPSNRKWIATQASGLYLVNEDGTEILEHFTKDNTPLVSNTIYTVVCDPSSNDVLIGTPEGMYLYSSSSAPAADTYDEVYAFPNPVRPEYTGWITINGLMDNSLVKIADMQGNVFWEGRSEGGMVVWDGCNRDGRRVSSGVYTVFASQNADGSSSGAVTKIVVIN